METSFVDNGTEEPEAPFYPEYASGNRGFYDRSWRYDTVWHQHWTGELFLATRTEPKTEVI